MARWAVAAVLFQTVEDQSLDVDYCMVKGTSLATRPFHFKVLIGLASNPAPGTPVLTIF